MRPELPVVVAAVLTLALSGAALVRAESESEKLLNQSAFAESQDSTQVSEEKAIEKKDGMDAPADNPAGTAGSQAKDPARRPTVAPAAPK